MAHLLTCKTCGATQIPETWFGQCKRCYDLPDTDMLIVPTYAPYTKLPPLEDSEED